MYRGDRPFTLPSPSRRVGLPRIRQGCLLPQGEGSYVRCMEHELRHGLGPMGQAAGLMHADADHKQAGPEHYTGGH